MLLTLIFIGVQSIYAYANDDFITASGTHFMLNGKIFRFIGFNAYGMEGCYDGKAWTPAQLDAYFSKLPVILFIMPTARQVTALRHVITPLQTPTPSASMAGTAKIAPCLSDFSSKIEPDAVNRWIMLCSVLRHLKFPYPSEALYP